MRRGFKRPYQPGSFFRTNDRIAANSLRVLDAEGKQVGLLTKQEALQMAREQGIDLVEIAPKAVPPVAKIIDFKKFLYQQKKKKKEEKKHSTTSEMKQIWLGPFIDEHDLDFKLERAREFLQDGHKVKFAVKFRGREITKKFLGDALLRRVVAKLEDIAKVEREIHMEGRQMVVILSKGALKKEENNEKNEEKQIENQEVREQKV